MKTKGKTKEKQINNKEKQRKTKGTERENK